jgi:hypothetical protein
VSTPNHRARSACDVRTRPHRAPRPGSRRARVQYVAPDGSVTGHARTLITPISSLAPEQLPAMSTAHTEISSKPQTCRGLPQRHATTDQTPENGQHSLPRRVRPVGCGCGRAGVSSPSNASSDGTARGSTRSTVPGPQDSRHSAQSIVWIWRGKRRAPGVPGRTKIALTWGYRLGR